MAKQGEHGISWTEVTWNPIRGCSRVSEGCRECYAEGVAARFSGPGQPYEGLAKLVSVDRWKKGVGGVEERREPRWTGVVAFVDDHLADPLRWKKPRRVFVNSMSDLFHEKVPNDWIDRIFAVMALAPKHTFQTLTKRAERMREYCNELDTRRRIGIAMLDLIKEGEFNSDGITVPLEHRPDSTDEEPRFWSAWPLPNVWMGVSAENQETADERVQLLLQTPAAVRWVSYEPALGPVDFTNLHPPNYTNAFGHSCGLPNLDWIVCGGESGPRARPMGVDWAIQAREQCHDAGVAFFMKQLGGWPNKRGELSDFPAALRVREYPR